MSGIISDNLQSNGIPGVYVTKANGTKFAFVPSADTDAARGVALENAFAAAVAGDTIDLSPGDYLVAKSTTTISGVLVQYIILSGMTIRLNGARLYHESAQATYVMFSAGFGNEINDWSLLGPGIIEGTDPTPGISATGEVGLRIAGGSNDECQRFQVDGITFRYFTNAGCVIDGMSWDVNDWKFPTGKFSNCVFDYNVIGIDINAGSEFMQFSNCSFCFNYTGVNLYAGNTMFSNCLANGNIKYGVRLRDGSNHGHGTWQGGTIDHNYDYGVFSIPTMVNGFKFVNTAFLGSDATTPNKLQLDGYGIIVASCDVDSPIYTSAVNGGFNLFDGNYIAANASSILTNLFSGSRQKLLISDCFTSAGPWNQNDVQVYVYADNTAALAGGLIAGQRYRTSSGEIRIVV